MLIDIICFFIIVMALFKGASQGLIVALFTFISYFIGLAAATKLSVVVAAYAKQNIHIDGYWLPIFSFIVVFIVVVMVIRTGARLIKTVVKTAFLGWADALGGFVLYAILYLMVFSVLLFFATQIHLISIETQHESKTYTYIQPLGPKVLGSIGTIIPLFKNMFADLQAFFQQVSTK